VDRRQQKTRDAIFRAFGVLLERKNYNHITVQEIIDEANIGRSTFYAHFETKDELLRSMCTDIFQHVFSKEPVQERNHNFSEDSDHIEKKMTHIFYHLQDNQKNLKGILGCESQEIFMGYFKKYLAEMFEAYICVERIHAPGAYVLNQAVSSFAETVRWWITKYPSYSPEEITGFYLETVSADIFMI